MDVESQDKKRRNSSFKLVDEKALIKIINNLNELDDVHREFLKERWLRQVMWWDQRARSARWKYYTLRSIVIIVGTSIPAVASLYAASVHDFKVFGVELNVRHVIVVLSLLVSMCAALEGLFNYGAIWREKRRAAELLKVEGWRFFQNAVEYSGGHKRSYSRFAARVESIIEQEIEEYTALIRREPEDEAEDSTESKGIPPRSLSNGD